MFLANSKFVVAAGLFALLFVATAEGAYIVGNLHDDGQLVGNEMDGNDTLAKVNELIGIYNSTVFDDDPGPELELAIAPLGKILNDDGDVNGEGEEIGTFVEGSPLLLSDFTFYKADKTGSFSVDVGALTVALSVIDNDLIFEQNFVAFEYGGLQTIQYYTAKGSSEWSLWSYQGPGTINPVFFDEDADLDTIVDGFSDHSLSHISFYGVPEPSTLAIWGVLGSLGLIAAARRRKRLA